MDPWEKRARKKKLRTKASALGTRGSFGEVRRKNS
jgi:hypothetical protein